MILELRRLRVSLLYTDALHGRRRASCDRIAISDNAG
jgi:hypothetical protein